MSISPTTETVQLWRIHPFAKMVATTRSQAQRMRDRPPLLRLPWELVLKCTDFMDHPTFVCDASSHI